MLPFQNCYFRVRFLDMWGGDIQKSSQLSSEDEAIVFAKSRINFNPNYCATIVHINGLFYACIKSKIHTNPQASKLWHCCQTIFYGKKITRLNESWTIKYPDQTIVKLTYFTSEGLDMNGGDLDNSVTVESDFDAQQLLKNKLAYNVSLCGSIKKKWSDGNYTVQVKEMRKSNPKLKMEEHYCTTAFYIGEQI